MSLNNKKETRIQFSNNFDHYIVKIELQVYQGQFQSCSYNTFRDLMSYVYIVVVLTNDCRRRCWIS